MSRAGYLAQASRLENAAALLTGLGRQVLTETYEDLTTIALRFGPTRGRTFVHLLDSADVARGSDADVMAMLADLHGRLGQALSTEELASPEMQKAPRSG